MSRRAVAARRMGGMRVPRQSTLLLPYTISGLAYWLDPERYNDGALAWTLNGSKVASAQSRESSDGTIDATKTAAQGVDGNRPVLVTGDSVFNGRNSVQFTASSSQRLQTGTWTATVAQPTTVYVVASVTSAAAIRTMVDGLTTGGRHTIQTTLTNGYTSISAGNAVADTTGTADGVARVRCIVFNGVSSEIYVNNATTATATGNALTQAPTGLSLGCTFGLANFLDGKLGTVLLYTGAHTTAQRQALMLWLGSRYGVTVTP